MRDDKGRFVAGVSSSPETQFKPGQHWRKQKPYWDRDWLDTEYTTKKRSANEIADDWNITSGAILHWLRRHGIQRRETSDVRANKHWGSAGEENPMFGKNGADNPNWQGGIAPERQAFYSSREWKSACAEVWKRDNATCQRCGLRCKKRSHGTFHIHHIVGFADKELRANPSNLVLLCRPCHHFVHSKENVSREYLR